MTTDSAGVSGRSRFALPIGRAARTPVPAPAAESAAPAAPATQAATVVPPRGRSPRPAPAGRRPGAPRPRTVAALLFTADACAAALTVVLAVGGRRGAVLLLPALAVSCSLNAAGRLYRPAPAAAALDELPRLLGGSAVAWCVAGAALAAVRPSSAVGWSTLLTLISGQALAACAARALVHAGRRRLARRRPGSVLVVGSGPAGRRIAAALHRHTEYGLRPVALVAPGPASGPASGPGSGSGPAPGAADVPPLPLLTTPRQVARALTQEAVRDAFFTRAPQRPRDAALVKLFWERGCTVWLVDPGPAGTPGPAASWQGARPRDHLWGFACRRLEPPPRRRVARVAKRALDIALAALALLLAAPLLAACAAAVRLADGPGVIFRQERLGQDGRPFVILKFRTLRPADETESATRWSVTGDGRMSTVGRLLRRTSLDELPQLWNVLRGDMSLVGPRPERPYFAARFGETCPGYAQRLRMPAGLTGLAQISGLRGDTSIDDRARFDNHYIDTWSLWQDVRIMLRTTAACFRLGGS
ncbi:exopolysaccharide biosynthesis polyprenyl glycosylphosphotransferase [Streptomyces aidingensis]|uniref:Exopolysaccharide biosynthesis polyprenyl glycosylphosphotransferase n=1 Tax=Streptomyces aidingensis TaxID=910347 RepID=A0A1I1QMX9_9ACTN|nr:exopolysaccharide biosynthesis polyprenyl glycosylphosphotransferase [Streptomyces aidingensis]SFD23409.1 exopolysaccharide biosynthesis polyprenyl glycosylphosphotransferase [Streptomyces aidingensis]